MDCRILSLNIGGPVMMEWNGKSVLSSMQKHPVSGPLKVHAENIEGDSFADLKHHGRPHSVLYAFGMTSALEYMRQLGREGYAPGTLGENVTLEKFAEEDISVGDVFRFGTVLAQATYPRIPCAKLILRLKDARGLKAMQECGRTGVYFRILRTGEIDAAGPVQRTERARHPFTIADYFRKFVSGGKFSRADLELAVANGAFPEKMHQKWVEELASS